MDSILVSKQKKDQTKDYHYASSCWFVYLLACSKPHSLHVLFCFIVAFILSFVSFVIGLHELLLILYFPIFMDDWNNLFFPFIFACVVKWTHKPCILCAFIYIEMKLNFVWFASFSLAAIPVWIVILCSLNVAPICSVYVVCVCILCKCTIPPFSVEYLYLIFHMFGIFSVSLDRFSSKSFSIDILTHQKKISSALSFSCHRAMKTSETSNANDTGTNGVRLKASERVEKRKKQNWWILFIFMRLCMCVHCTLLGRLYCMIVEHL